MGRRRRPLDLPIPEGLPERPTPAAKRSSRPELDDGPVVPASAANASAPQRVILRCISGDRVGATYAIGLDRTPVGRARSSDFAPAAGIDLCEQEETKASGSVSRRHAEIARRETGYEIVDLGSMNGTKVNDERLTPGHPYQFAAGDTIAFGGVELLVELA